MLPLTGEFIGREAVLNWFVTLASDLEMLAFEVSDYVLHGDTDIIVFGFERVRVRKTGQIYETYFVHRLRLHNDQVKHFREYTDTGTQIAARKRA